MTQQLDIVAIIPARAGSKRLPGKNMLPLAGKPLIQWSLDAAKESGVVDLILVTSDDPAVLELARQQDVMAIKRPLELASDTATTVDAVLNALQQLESKGYSAQRVVLLQPTSPLRTAQNIQAAVQRMEETSATSIVSVCAMDHTPLWANTLPHDGNMDQFLSTELINKRSQDLPTYYRLNGAVYLINKQALIDHHSFFVPPTYALLMDRTNSVDIDTAEDLVFAEFLSRQQSN